MYCAYYGFKEKPFTVTPNPRFVFLSKNHKEAFAHLLYGIDNHAGFIVLTGEVGTGKTTVLRTLLVQCDKATTRSALILNPSLSATDLLRAINREYGIAWEGLSGAELLDALNRFLLEENKAGRTVVLVIDEAQNLDPPVLEQIRMISNLETETDKLIQIVLAGQPELAQMLEKTELRQFRQRVTVRYHLAAMDFDDTKAYIEHRLEVAGGWKAATFTGPALKGIFRYTGGIPRLINIVCDRALLIGYIDESKEISGPMAARAVAEMKEHRGRSRLYRLAWGVVLAASAIIAGIYFYMSRPAGKIHASLASPHVTAAPAKSDTE
ncbi:MAG TPA: AAA family ATPase [Geobacteraceae bacterium]|nr:AAA family ATPase [Geobacteraceae bacterium]